MPEITDSYVYWTHKGGVGKTTLCLHSALTWAKMATAKPAWLDQ